MSASAADQPRRLVDMEFRPGELPAAEASARLDAGQGRGEGRDLLEGAKRTSLAAWLALGASTVILLLVVGNAAVSFASNAFRQGSVVDLALLLALIVLVGSILTLLGRQAQALRKLKSAERAREMDSQQAGAAAGALLRQCDRAGQAARGVDRAPAAPYRP